MARPAHGWKTAKAKIGIVRLQHRKEHAMADLKIRIFKDGEGDPQTTITIPSRVLNVASKLIPGRARRALEEKGIKLEELVNLTNDPDVAGRLIEIEDHTKKERITISAE
jgi:hypothetical protein